jgi:thiamine biosynthesis lipoprotein ApbE
MPRISHIAIAAVLVVSTLVVGIGKPSRTVAWHDAHFENVLGTSMEIKLMAASDYAAESAETAAMNEIKRLNRILSGYDKDSEFSRWAATQQQCVRVSPELMEVLRLWDFWRNDSGGALNPAAEAVTRVWKQAQADGRMPTDAEMAAAAHAAGRTQWRLEASAGTATHLSATPLMLNSFTKSYIVDRAASVALRTPGVSGVVLNIGGDLAVRGQASDRIDVANPMSDAENAAPMAVLNIKDKAVATSGNYRRGFDIGGRHYSHIVDPRTGRTADDIIGATVVARNAVDAGALATAFCVLSPQQSSRLAATVPGSEYLLVAKDGTRFASAGWSSLLVAQAAAPRKATTPAGTASLWNSAYELTVNVEIPQTQGFGARRPYVAVWIEDNYRYPVRTLAVLYEKARWLNELRAWYRDDRLRALSEGTEILNSVTSATRSPGKYSFKWDGQDNSGKLVKAGKYTVMVEAAREHGGYNLVRKEMNFDGEPAEMQVPADGELGVVAFDYHKAAH